MFKLTPDQQDIINNGAVLFRALSQNKSDTEFGKIVIGFQKAGGDINALSQTGHTILDVALSLPQYFSKAQFLKDCGARTSREIGHIPNDISDKIIEAYDPNASNLMPTAEPSKSFNGDLYNVNLYIKSHHQLGEDDFIVNQLNKSKNSVGLMTASGMGIGTCFLIANDMIITSRHVLNGAKVNELKMMLPDIDVEIEVSGLIEDGSNFQLDYVVLRLKTSVNDAFILKLSSSREVTYYTFVGYDSDEEMYFTNYMPQSTLLALVGTHQETFQETGFSFSGSPYFNENDDVYALHQNTGNNKKQSLYIADICERHDNLSINDLITQWRERELLEIHGGVFEFVSLSAISQYDEGEARGYTLGKNPSVSKDELGGKSNLVCQEVLYRWALRQKARYIGNKANKQEWIQDWENWEVFVRKNDGADREWVGLNEKRLNGKPAIQMGHKLSAVSYWVYGYNHATNTILKNDFSEYKKSKGDQKHLQKKVKYDNRYALFSTAGFRQVEAGNAVVNRKFMYMAENYRFEWAELNEQHGKAEGKVLTYNSIFSLQPAPTQDELKKYRALRKDKETSPIIQSGLLARRGKLTNDIITHHQQFIKK